MSDYKDLKVWQLAVELAIDVYKIVELFPRTEIYGLTDQIKRSAVSIPSNIAEGAGRSTNKDYAHFVSIAHGSACELETQLLIAKSVLNVPTESFGDVFDKIIVVRKMLIKLRQSLLR